MTQSLIITADDFGLHPDIDRGIIECVEGGSVTSISVALCGLYGQPDPLVLQNLKISFPNLSIGIHLMLTGGRPLSRASLPLDKAGCFHGHITNILSPLLLRTIDLDAVRIEWETQIQRFLSFGIPLEHLNSHQHVHLLPGLWKQAISLGRQYKIPHLRTGYQSISQAVFTGSVFKIMFQFIAWLRFCAVQERRYTLGVLCSCNFSLVKIKSALETMVRKGNLIELMVHPGVTTKELLQCFGSWNAQWDQERKELSNLRNFLEKMS